MRGRNLAGQPAEMERRCGPNLGRTMSSLGYRTFGIGKFHTAPWDEDLGYETLLRSEETYNQVTREDDSYASWLAREHPEFNFLEHIMENGPRCITFRKGAPAARAGS
jgi:arylsulfatase